LTHVVLIFSANRQ